MELLTNPAFLFMVVTHQEWDSLFFWMGVVGKVFGCLGMDFTQESPSEYLHP